MARKTAYRIGTGVEMTIWISNHNSVTIVMPYMVGQDIDHRPCRPMLADPIIVNER
jgi:hypothetical protein